MTRRITLTIPHQSEAVSYPIVIGSEILQTLPTLLDLHRYSRVLLLVDKNVEEVVTPRIAHLLSPTIELLSVACGEKFKDFKSLEALLAAFHERHLDRKSLIVNIGGGMLGDFGGFAASIYMRGLPFVQVPTTLLAQVDASVGGKVAINFAGVKNLVGAFQQPAMVVIDVALLKSLPRREFLSGFAEIIKHAIIQDLSLFDLLEANDPETLEEKELLAIIEHSCAIKANVVQQDPHEAGLRRILNFGHTIGHAIETLASETASPLLHGECVALGMMAEAALSVGRGALSDESFNRIGELLKRYHLPVHLVQKFSTEALFERMLSDKKNASGTILMALPNTLGSCQPQVAVTNQQISRALDVLYQ